MKAKLLSAILIIAGVACLHSAAQAQGLARLQMTHDFTVGSATLPAGHYTILRFSPETSNGLLIRNDNGKSAIFVVPKVFESRNGGDSQLHFLRSGDAYALTEVDTANGAYFLFRNHNLDQEDKAGSLTVSGQ